MDNNLKHSSKTNEIKKVNLTENEKYYAFIETLYNQEKEDIDKVIKSLKKYIIK